MKKIIEAWEGKINQCALRYFDKSISYQDLLTWSCQLGNLFNQNKFERILFCHPNSPSLILCYLAGWLTGKTLIPVNPRLTNYELTNVINQFQPDFILLEDTRLHDDISYLPSSSGKIYTVMDESQSSGSFWDAIRNQAENMPEGYNPNALTIHLTSGTTGLYKSVPHTLSQIEQYAIRRADDFGYVNDDHLLIVTSLNHAFSFSYQFLPAIVLGSTISLVPSFDPKLVYDVILQNKVTVSALLPVMSYQLARYAQEIQHQQSLSLKYVLVAGDALPSAFNQLFNSVFGVNLLSGIGMTEVFGYAQNFINCKKVGSAGMLLRGVELQVRDNKGITLEQSQIGEIYLKTEMNLFEYGNDKLLTKEFITQDGWLKTGDIGYLDSDKFLWFHGRKKQIIIRGGSNISPAEVEQVLYRSPDIIEAGVVGKKDQIWGQVVWAYVCMIKGALFEPEKLIQMIGHYIAEYKIPQKIILLESMPKTSSGKIDRNLLAEWADNTNNDIK